METAWFTKHTHESTKCWVNTNVSNHVMEWSISTCALTPSFSYLSYSAACTISPPTEKQHTNQRHKKGVQLKWIGLPLQKNITLINVPKRESNWNEVDLTEPSNWNCFILAWIVTKLTAKNCAAIALTSKTITEEHRSVLPEAHFYGVMGVVACSHFSLLPQPPLDAAVNLALAQQFTLNYSALCNYFRSEKNHGNILIWEGDI